MIVKCLFPDKYLMPADVEVDLAMALYMPFTSSSTKFYPVLLW